MTNHFSKLFFAYALLGSALTASFSACQSKSGTRQAAQEAAVATVNYALPDSAFFDIVAVSTPDSVMGDRLIDDGELDKIFALREAVSDRVFKRTDNLRSIDPADEYVMALAGMQYDADQAMHYLMCEPTFTDRFTGWKVRVRMERAFPSGDTLKVLRYCFTTPDGHNVIKTLDFPIL